MPTLRRIRWAKFRVTALTTAATAILAVFLYLLTGGNLLASKATIYVYMPDVTGLSSSSPVRVNGIDIGKVVSVRLSGSSQPDRVVQVAMRVETAFLSNVPVDSSAQIGADTLVGDRFVDITSGRGPEHIQPGGEVPYKAPSDMLKTLDMAQFEARMRTMDATLRDLQEGRGELGQFVQGQDMYQDLLRRTGEIERTMREAVSATSAVGQALYSDELYQRISRPIEDLDRDLARLQAGQGTGGHLLRDSAQYDQARRQVAGLRRSIADMRAAEFLKSDGMYAQWNRALAAWIGKVDSFNASPSLQTTADYDNLNGMAAQARDTLREFREDPRKFLRMKVF
jgi:phospholipid/cholesterol/gamma-HCH transport system substrate-binding protein